MNQIAAILKNRGIEDLAPNQKTLVELGVKLHTWNKWVHNKKDPEMWQLPIIARFLDCEIEDLFPAPENKTLRAKHGLITA
jgi:DNA-binding XRE family transcriptional regulator